MELTDLTKEQRDKLNSKLMPMLASEKIDQKIFDFILSEHPKLVYITMEQLVEYARFCTEESKTELVVEREKLRILQINYELKKKIISEKFKLTLDEVEEINERFKFKRWVALPVTFRIIVLYWKLKRIFRGSIKA
ncbi:hypothetical protein [Lactococcus formosensis]|uniref:hypothetical protein n=1 Tax=Lactococcus formosensis TaxID=1281486 RepID=UPI0031FEC447